nr:reverse transcriptase domain-containing protein [Tanacetum cinerariifolium]
MLLIIHPLPIFDEYDDDLFEVDSDTKNVYDDPFDPKGEIIKESRLLINKLDLLYDFLPSSEYDSFVSEDFSRFDALPSTNNEDKVFNPGILIQENLFEIITCVVQDKKLAISNAFLMLEDFDPPLYEFPFFKEVPSIPENLKTRAKGFCPPVFISSASLGNHPRWENDPGKLWCCSGYSEKPRWENEPRKLGAAPDLLYKDLLRACPHHGFTKLHQLDTFYNALNPADQDSLNAAAGGNLLERRAQDVDSQTYSCSQSASSAVTTGMTAILKQYQATPPPASVKTIEEICVTCGGAHPYYQCLAADGNTFPELRDNIQGYVSAAAVNYNQGSGSLPSNTVANPKGKLKAITTQSGIVLDGPTVPIPPPFINPEEDERVEETLTDSDLSEYTIKKMLKALLSNKEKLQELANTLLNENCSAVILKKLPEKLGDPGKFLIPCGFNELKCKALANLDASINLIPLSVWKKLAYFVIFDYESDHKVSFILGRPFLRTARALIDVHGEEMILRDGDERLTLNMRHDTSSYSNQPQKESINLINVFNDLEYFLEDLFSTNQPKGGNVLLEKLLDLDSIEDLHPHLHVNPLNGSTTYSSSPNPLLEELVDELDIDSSLKDSTDQSNLANPADNFVNSMPEMFTDEHAPDYSSHSIFDKYDDDLLEVESDTKNVYDDPFDSKGEKIKESKLLIDELDLPCDFLPPSEYDLFISEDFSRVDALPSTNNEDKVFNLGILIQENPFEIITRVVQDKKLATSNASLMLEDSDPPLYEPLFFKEVPRSSSKLARDQTSNPTSSTNPTLKGAARRGLEKEPPCSITTWDHLVLKFINESFPPSRTTNLRNEISNFQQTFDESFHEAWERYKDLLRACPHHGFTELHQLDTFYNALNPADQDSLNAAAGGNLLEKSPQDALMIIENKSK